MGYKLLCWLVRLMLAVFYRRIEVVGLERIPTNGALIVAANHHNSVVDAMILLSVVPRRLRPLATAPLFSHPLLGPLLRLAGALPVHRRQEAGDDPTRNDALFSATTATLREGGAIMIFPEGKTQPEPVLQELRTGAARMLLAAQDDTRGGAPVPVTLLPVGLYFEKPGTFREGHAVVMIGEAVSSADLPAVDGPRILTQRLEAALRALFVEAPDRDILRQASLVASMTEPASDTPVEHLQRLRVIMAGYRWLATHQPQRLAALGVQLRALTQRLEQAGLPGDAKHWQPGSPATMLHKLVLLLISAPLALCGIAMNLLPATLTRLAVRLIPHTDEEEATDLLASGLVLFPLSWLAEAWLAWQLGSSLALGMFVALLVPASLCSVWWLDEIKAMRREVGVRLHPIRHRDSSQRCATQRNELLTEIDNLAARLPLPPHNA